MASCPLPASTCYHLTSARVSPFPVASRTQCGVWTHSLSVADVTSARHTVRVDFPTLANGPRNERWSLPAATLLEQCHAGTTRRRADSRERADAPQNRRKVPNRQAQHSAARRRPDSRCLLLRLPSAPGPKRYLPYSNNNSTGRRLPLTDEAVELAHLQDSREREQAIRRLALQGPVGERLVLALMCQIAEPHRCAVATQNAGNVGNITRSQATADGQLNVPIKFGLLPQGLDPIAGEG